jgi:hypothetical protein
MDDSFNFGRPSRTGRGPTNVAPFLIIAIALAIAATLVGAALLTIKRGGEAAGEANQRAVDTIDRANDVQAQATLQAASRAALTVQAETGSLAGATPESLAAHDSALTFTSGPSTGPSVVSVAVGGDMWGAAAKSASGSCLWVRVDAAGSISYGAGPSCTGAAALSASQPTW